jgi:uncharacterized protein
VRIRVSDLSEQVRQVEFVEQGDALNDLVASSTGFDEQRFEGDITVKAELYRYGGDVHSSGSLSGSLACTCCRCLEDFHRPLARDFKFLLVDSTAYPEGEADEGLDYHNGEEIDLGALAREQALLALDSLALCSEDCLGLCAGCGANLNKTSCSCPVHNQI